MFTFGFDKNDFRLAMNFAKMTLKDRYLGSKFGMIWAIINPLLMLGIYTFVFGFVFKVRLPGAATTLAYAVWLISGYGPWLAISEAILSGAYAVVSGAGMIKNMPFKTEILPISAVMVAIVPLVVSLFYLLILMFFAQEIPSWHVIFLIPVIILQFVFIIGISFFISTLTVFVRDIGIVLPNILMALLFATPIFYPLESMPRIIKLLSVVNPFYILAQGYRLPLLEHKIPSILSLGYVGVLSLILWFFGLQFFRKAKGYFAAML